MPTTTILIRPATISRTPGRIILDYSQLFTQRRVISNLIVLQFIGYAFVEMVSAN